MRKRWIVPTLLVPAIAALAVGIASADHRDPAAADADGDGFVSLDEFEAAHAARVRERFARMDENADGLLSAEELERQGRDRHSGPRRHHRPDPDRIVEHLDADGSGSLSLAEMDGRRFVPDAAAFAAADADGNGELDGSELANLLAAHREQRREHWRQQRDEQQ